MSESDDDSIDANDLLNMLEAEEKIKNPYRTISEDARTIVLIGRTCTGKTTIANVLESAIYIAPLPVLCSKTRLPEVHQIGTFQLIDLPGFFDHQTHANRHEQMTNETINSYLDNYLKNCTGVHLFAFVFSLSTGINDEDIECMRYVKTNYPQISEYLALVLTSCEEQTESYLKRLVDQFFLNPAVIKYQLNEFFKQGVLYMGCLRRQTFEARDSTALRKQHDNVLKMRKKFIEKCLACSQTYIHNQKDVAETDHAQPQQPETDRSLRTDSLFLQSTRTTHVPEQEFSWCERSIICIKSFPHRMWHFACALCPRSIIVICVLIWICKIVFTRFFPDNR